EIWGPYVKQPDFFKIGYLNIENYLLTADKRITCDYEADYAMIKLIYKNLSGGIPDLNDFATLYMSQPEIFDLNSGIIQRTLDSSVIKRIERDFNSQKNRGKEYIKNRGFDFSPSVIEKSIVV
ncbi:MAG: hypothetical protein LC630_07555, partial [Bacteroidales bacterium]|nr:hypothetical protein [Bacteroidales bacterium]